jgi:hypothetical protein
MITVRGNEAVVDGARVREALDALDGPRDDAKLMALYRETMAKLEEQRRPRWGRPFAQLLNALSAWMF